MFPDARWLEALKLPLRVMLGITFSSGALLLLEYIDVLDLAALSAAARPIVIAVCAVSTVFTIVGVVDLSLAPRREKKRRSTLSTRRAIRREEAERNRLASEARTLTQLDHLSKEEIRYVAECLRDGTPSFYPYGYSSAIAMLGGKGLIWSPGGEHDMERYPVSFHDFVWKVLLARKDEFIARDDERKRAGEAERRRRR